YLVTDTTPVVNTFTPATVSTDVTDDISGNTKSNVQIKNNSNIPVYMRVAVVANWYSEDGKVVAPWSDYEKLGVNSTNWTYSGGYYYYNGTVAAGATVTLFDSYTATGGPEGAHLEMDIIAQVIQAEGMGATSAQDAFNKAANS
ncbi:MAG: hypothetical protein ACI4MF_10100, partial [Candidatus Faecivicinus sp.]